MVATKNRRDVVAFEANGLDRATRKAHARQVREELSRASLIPEEGPARVAENLPAVHGRTAVHGPAAAASGAGGFRSTLRIKQLGHRFSSLEAAGIFPFLTGSRADPLGVPMGIDLETQALWCFDPWRWYEQGLIPSTGILVMGGYRQGKSFFLKRLIKNLVAVGYQAINTSDSKGEHVALAHALGGLVFEVGAPGSQLRINGLDAGTKPAGMPEDVWRVGVQQRRSALLQQIVSILLGQSAQLRATERSVIQWALEVADAESHGEPTIRQVYMLLGDVVTGRRVPEDLGDVTSEAKQLWHTLRRLVDGDLAGMFEDTSTVKLDAASPYMVFDTFAMASRGDTALAITQAITQSWVQSILQDKRSGRKWVIAREEGWRDMNSVAALEAQRLQQKLAGEFGICQLLVVHEGGDFEAVGAEGSKERALAEELAKGFAVKISFAQERGQLAASARAVGLTDAQAGIIGTLRKGECCVCIGQRAILVDTMPVSTSWEKTVFNTDQAMISTATGPIPAPTDATIVDTADAHAAAPADDDTGAPAVEDPDSGEDAVEVVPPDAAAAFSDTATVDAEPASEPTTEPEDAGPAGADSPTGEAEAAVFGITDSDAALAHRWSSPSSDAVREGELVAVDVPEPRRVRRPKRRRRAGLWIATGSILTILAGVAVGWPLVARSLDAQAGDATAAAYTTAVQSWSDVWTPARVQQAIPGNPGTALAGSVFTTPAADARAAVTQVCAALPATGSTVETLAAATLPALPEQARARASAAYTALDDTRPVRAAAREHTTAFTAAARDTSAAMNGLCASVAAFAATQDAYATSAARLAAVPVIPEGGNITAGTLTVTCTTPGGCLDLYTPERRAAYVGALDAAYTATFRALAENWKTRCPLPSLAPVCTVAATENTAVADAYANLVAYLRGTAPTVQAGTAAYPRLTELAAAANERMTAATTTILAAWQKIDPAVKSMQDTGASVARLADANRQTVTDRADAAIAARCELDSEGC